MNYCWKKRKKKKYPSCRKCCLAPQNCSKSTKWKCSLQEPGHHLRMEYERAVRIGPKSDSWNDWLISIFVGSGAVIQRADGKLCNCEGRDWSRRTVGKEFQKGRRWERQRDSFREIVGVFCFSAEATAGHLQSSCMPAILPSACTCACVWLNRLLMREALCSPACLSCFSSIVMWGYVEESQATIGLLISQGWKMKRIHLPCVLKELCFMPSAMIGTPHQWRHVSGLGPAPSSSGLISHVFPMHLPHLGALLSAQAFISLLLCQAAAHAHLVIVVLN